VLRPKLSADDYSLVIRTDFSAEPSWQRLCTAIQSPQTEDGFRARVECLSDPTCNGLSPEDVCRLVPDTDAYRFVFIVDGRALVEPDHPVLVVDTKDPSLQFRVAPEEAWAVENNLALANIDFDEFQTALDPDGVFRGFERSS